MDCWMDSYVGGWMSGCVDGWMDGQTGWAVFPSARLPRVTHSCLDSKPTSVIAQPWLHLWFKHLYIVTSTSVLISLDPTTHLQQLQLSTHKAAIFYSSAHAHTITYIIALISTGKKFETWPCLRPETGRTGFCFPVFQALYAILADCATQSALLMTCPFFAKPVWSFTARILLQRSLPGLTWIVLSHVHL